MNYLSSPELSIYIEPGQIVKISVVSKVNDDIYRRELWLEVKSKKESLVTINGEDFEISHIWERKLDVVKEDE